MNSKIFDRNSLEDTEKIALKLSVKAPVKPKIVNINNKKNNRLSVKQRNALVGGGADNFIEECKSGSLSPMHSPVGSSASPRRFKILAAQIREKNRREAEEKNNSHEYKMPKNGLNVSLNKKI